ncbi:MAG: dUTP pyrophosphatase [Clostridia bacterium]|nr:dUTP pyrophosphatase [Clostridia bacterium]
MSSVTVYFAKVKPNAVIPSKREEDAGYDIYACLDSDYLSLLPQQTLLVPTGIASACPTGYYFQIQERGSTGSKGLAKRCGVIDSGYRGEWFLPLTNVTDHPLYIAKPHAQATIAAMHPNGGFHAFYTDKAIVQAILLALPKAVTQEVSYEALCAIQSERGTGALGSSQK